MIEIQMMSIDDIHEYKRNPRINKKAVPAVMESIKQCGYIAPIIVDENGVILAGHTRYRALKQLGEKNVPVIVKAGLTEEQKKKYRILDNKVGELSYWDYEKLYKELVGLDFDNFEFGFEKLTEAIDQTIYSGFEYDTGDFGDEKFENECPECGFKF